jgi:hypothetical protein
VVYDKILRDGITTLEKKDCMWQQQCTNKWKGAVNKAFFLSVRKRLRQKIPTFLDVTMITGHGKLRSCLHRYGIIGNPMCPYGEEEQTTDHLILQCKKFRNQMNEIIK